MKTKSLQNRKNLGNVLVAALVITACAGIVLLATLSMVTSQNYSIGRSQLWNLQIPIVEAGIEEAIAHLNYNCYVDDLKPTGEAADWTADGWQSVANGVYKKTTLPDGSYYEVTIINTNPSNPTIFSEGHCDASPLVGRRPSVMFAQIGNGLTSSEDARTVRKVRVNTSAGALFANGLVAKNYIDMNGNGVTTDSFDSSEPAFSTDGQYDPVKHRAHGDIASALGLVNVTTINVGNANIWGNATTAPGGKISVGSQGSIGDEQWHLSGQKGIQPGHGKSDLNVSFPDVKIPEGGSSVPGGGTITNWVITNAVVTILTNSYPYGEQSIKTNTTTITSTVYPSSGIYVGKVYTNTYMDTSSSLPSSGTYIGNIVTNTVTTSTPNQPAAGTYIGAPLITTVSVTAGSIPAAGTYIGAINTNYSFYPSSSTYPNNALGPVTTNYTTSATYPRNPPGSVKVNTTLVTTPKKSSPPPVGTYIPGSLTGSWAQGYTYKRIDSYTYWNGTYSYTAPNGTYTYNVPSGYTYQSITGYSFNRVKDYTYAQLDSYSYAAPGLSSNIVSRVYYDHILDNDLYTATSIEGTVYVRGNASLYITGSLNLLGINIGPEGCLKLYSGAESASLAGNGVVNEPGLATKFFFYGLPTCKSVTLSGNASFIGCIYAPSANLTLNGGGNNRTDFIGAAVFNNVTLNGHFNFHYDEALRKYGPTSGYTITSWEEVPLN